LHTNPKLDIINGKPKKAVEHLVSVIKPAAIKDLIECKLEMYKMDLKKDFLEFVTYLEKMAIIYDEHCHKVDLKKTGNSGTKNMGKNNDVGGRSFEHNHRGSSSGSGCKNTSNRYRMKSDIGRSSDSSDTGKETTREPPPCLITNKYAGERHYLSDCLLTSKDDAFVLLAEYKKKRVADKEKASPKSLGSNEAMAENRYEQTAYLMAENLGFKVTVLADKGCESSAIPCSAVENARKSGLPLKVEVLPEPIILNMAIKGESDKQKCSATDMLISAATITTLSWPVCTCLVRQIIVEVEMDHSLIEIPVLDEMSLWKISI
jgi:hypothetical protein